jgi:hypothetical protein
MSSQSIPETADAHRLRTPDQPQGQIASSADTLRFAWGLASSTLGPIQMLCPWVFRALHDSPASEDFLGVRNALILPGQMNSYFWGPILASLPHLRPVQLGHGAVQVTLEVSLMTIQLLCCVQRDATAKHCGFEIDILRFRGVIFEGIQFSKSACPTMLGTPSGQW